MNTFLARTGSNSTRVLAIKCVCVCNLGEQGPAPPPSKSATDSYTYWTQN